MSALAATKNYTQCQYTSNPRQKGGYNSGSSGYYQWRETKEEKNKKWCDHCKMNGHTLDDCFKVHGYPEWFTKLRPKGEWKGKYAANVSISVEENYQDNPFDRMIQSDNKEDDKAHMELVSNLVQEVLKVMNQKQEGSTSTSNNNQSNFAGTISTLNAYSHSEMFDKESWIIDSF